MLCQILYFTVTVTQLLKMSSYTDTEKQSQNSDTQAIYAQILT